MSLVPRLTDAAANAAADAVMRQLDGGFIDIYSGSQPATADTVITSQVKLASLALNATSAPAASGGVATFNAISSDTAADATGTAAWFRAYRANHTTAVYDGSVGTSGANLNLNSVAIVLNGTVGVSAFTYTQAKS